ncbi:hypothetical protein [Nocardioides rubriscoriae]|uniref:hypothetical protein n=1 Tax=Nocardioides rubriscoriae TaxID=642762 RepID=UPI0011DF9582|nr:hypothetical protein [Nocardioides rubriscoriae]
MTTRRVRRATVALAGALLLSSGTLAGCSSDSSAESDRDETEGSVLADAADLTTCTADATPVAAPYGDGFPSDWAFPPQTTVYDVEERAGAGTIVTGVSTAPLDDVLAFLNDDQPAAGYTITGGETEDDDAEADFTLAKHSGRWSIRESSACEGETVIQVVAFER